LGLSRVTARTIFGVFPVSSSRIARYSVVSREIFHQK
jgi:hypothetical protein